MKRILALSTMIMTLGTVGMAHATAKKCSQETVMSTVHEHEDYKDFTYGSDYQGEQKAPRPKRGKKTDQYVFWIDDNGQSCVAIVTYDKGTCANGKAFVKMDACE